ncbi:unnamed protein product, partial [Trichobilharzia regenti]
LNPATGERLRSVPACSKEECEVCVNLASVSQKEWAAKSPDERSSVIRKWADTIRENVDSLAALITAENVRYFVLNMKFWSFGPYHTVL